eukprot:CAMPEP_0183412650 /NCGR_PEP_ID=MMETSP0370-20130417/21163_1 /TAXON_ID=268820 /ORGANISM="Peridinium aciculiferum, Strain PAER-2" /LENGTH=366 /DNA_ID=CAMNT_0025595779 /DNA_START=50 /DNA_END=1147 /DNA_ORIENTATION=+
MTAELGGQAATQTRPPIWASARDLGAYEVVQAKRSFGASRYAAKQAAVRAAAAGHAEGASKLKQAPQRGAKKPPTAAEQAIEEGELAEDLDIMLRGVGLNLDKSGMSEGWEAMLSLTESAHKRGGGNDASTAGEFGAQAEEVGQDDAKDGGGGTGGAGGVTGGMVSAFSNAGRGRVAEAAGGRGLGRRTQDIDPEHGPGCYAGLEERTPGVFLQCAGGTRGLPEGDFMVHAVKAAPQRPQWRKRLDSEALAGSRGFGAVATTKAGGTTEVRPASGGAAKEGPKEKPLERWQPVVEDPEYAKILEYQNKQYMFGEDKSSIARGTCLPRPTASAWATERTEQMGELWRLAEGTPGIAQQREPREQHEP